MTSADDHTASRSEETVEFFRACIGTADVWAGGPPCTRWLNGTLVDVDPGRIVIDDVVREEMANPAGLLHGGVQGAMLDDAIGLAAFTLGRDGFHLAVNLSTDYLGSTEVGATVRAEAEIVRSGSRIVYATGALTDRHGKPIARATSNLLWSPGTTSNV